MPFTLVKGDCQQGTVGIVKGDCQQGTVGSLRMIPPRFELGTPAVLSISARNHASNEARSYKSGALNRTELWDQK